ncbi:MAG: hypothetical protein H6671_15515 [Anaerolineaceae bacterium]|nr:hypothetical protein [Anaerolineaceae bacterium]
MSNQKESESPTHRVHLSPFVKYSTVLAFLMLAFLMPVANVQALANESFDGQPVGTAAAAFNNANVTWTGAGMITADYSAALGLPFAGFQLWNQDNAAFLTLTIDFAVPQNGYDFDYALRYTGGLTVNASLYVRAYYSGVEVDYIEHGPSDGEWIHVAHASYPGTIVYDQLVLTLGGNADAWLIDNFVTTDAPIGVTVTESGGTTNIAEGGATDTYTVVLDSQPIADVTINVTPDAQCTVSNPTLTFTTANWNVAQTITVTAVDDAVAEGAHNCAITHTATSADLGYNGLAVAGVTAAITDNDTAGVTVTESGGTTNIAEGGATDTYTVVLTSQPTANVTITVTPDAQCTVATVPLTFTAGNWNVAQTVTVTAVDDVVVEGAHNCVITQTAASGDANYNGIAVAGVTAAITDNDIAGVTITESGGTTDITEGGATDTYTVVLNTMPAANVTITVTPDAQCTVATVPLTFTAGNWNIAQTVTVTAVDDLAAEGVHNCVITQTAASGDANYNGVAVAGVTAAITDNDVAGVTVTESGGTTDIAEGGATDTYTVVLNTMPTGNVTINVTPDAQCTALPSPLTFTAGNWNVAQTVTVTAVDDGANEGAHTCTVSHAVAGGSAAEYLAVVIANVTANVTDNDAPGVTVSAAAVTVVEGGATGNYTLTLNTAPTGDVEITLTPDAQCVVTSANPVIFTAPNQGPLTVTVQAVDDAAVEGAHTCTVSHAITTSADANYPTTMVINNKVVNVTDNDGTAGTSTGIEVAGPPPATRCTDVNFEDPGKIRSHFTNDADRPGLGCRLIAAGGSYMYWLGSPITNAGNIGAQNVLNLGLVAAVDVFSTTGVTGFAGDVNICLQGSGYIIYMNASGAPRQPQLWSAWTTDTFPGYTCTTLYAPGTVVLVANAPTQ